MAVVDSSDMVPLAPSVPKLAILSFFAGFGVVLADYCFIMGLFFWSGISIESVSA